MLDDGQIEELRKRCGGKVGVVDFDGHQLVFRRPTRDEVREYRRKKDSPSEKPDALDQLAQATIVAFDGEPDTVRARTLFLGFLDEYPLFTSGPKPSVVFGRLTGLVEAEDADAMGKGVSVRSAPPKSTPLGSPSGSGASSPVSS